MKSKYSSSTKKSGKSSKLCTGLIFIILGLVFSFGSLTNYLGFSSTYISIFFIVIGIFIILMASKSKNETRNYLSPTTIKHPRSREICPKCGIKRSPGFNSCLRCGFQFYSEIKQVSPQPPPQKEEPIVSSVEPSFPPISELLQNKEVLETKENLTGNRDEVQEANDLIQKESKEILNQKCPECGEGLLEGAKFCFICGKKVEEIDSKPLISEIRREEPETISPPEPQFTHPVSEISREETIIIAGEDLTPIPEKLKKFTKLKPSFCEFCGIRLPKKSTFCLQCGMIIKNQ
jgi:hypothetical protein